MRHFFFRVFQRESRGSLSAAIKKVVGRYKLRYLEGRSSVYQSGGDEFILREPANLEDVCEMRANWLSQSSQSGSQSCGFEAENLKSLI